MAKMNDDELLAALGVEVSPVKVVTHTPREERIIAGFEDIVRFYDTHGRIPQNGADLDIFERLYAVRLEKIRKLPEALVLLADLDSYGLLTTSDNISEVIDAMDADTLLAELGVSLSPSDENDITVLRHVRSTAEKRAVDEVAQREKCEDFELRSEERRVGKECRYWWGE